MCPVLYINEKPLNFAWEPEIEDALSIYDPNILYQILSGKKNCFLENGEMVSLNQRVTDGMKLIVSDNVSPIPFVCTNIIDRHTGQGVRERFAICTVASIPVGIIGISSEKVISDYDSKIIEDLTILPPGETIKKFSAILRQVGVKLIVVISKAGLKEDEHMAEESNEIDIIINANLKEKAPWPTRKNEVWIIPQGSSIEEVENVFGLSFTIEVRFFFSELLRLMRKLC
jgi:hypothetical protein